MPTGKLGAGKKESQERDIKTTREIERLMNDHGNTNDHMMTSPEKRLDAKADLMMRKLDEILISVNRQDRHAPTDDSRQTTDGGEARGRAGAQSRSRTSLSLTIGRDPGQPRRGRVGQIPPLQKRKRRRGHSHRQCPKSDRCQI